MEERFTYLPKSLRRRLYLPAYTVVEAAHLAGTKHANISRWYWGYKGVGVQRRGGVFEERKTYRAPLSYLQLVEVAFVATMRELGVKLGAIRQARDYLSKTFETEFPFAQLELKTDGIHILKELSEEAEASKLIVADKSGQEAWAGVLADRFEQFDYENGLTLRWFPRGRTIPIIVDPRIAFGAPIILSAGVATWVLRERYKAGETLEELEQDFGISQDKLRLALDFEGMALAA